MSVNTNCPSYDVDPDSILYSEQQLLLDYLQTYLIKKGLPTDCKITAGINPYCLNIILPENEKGLYISIRCPLHIEPGFCNNYWCRTELVILNSKNQIRYPLCVGHIGPWHAPSSYNNPNSKICANEFYREIMHIVEFARNNWTIRASL